MRQRGAAALVRNPTRPLARSTHGWRRSARTGRITWPGWKITCERARRRTSHEGRRQDRRRGTRTTGQGRDPLRTPSPRSSPCEVWVAVDRPRLLAKWWGDLDIEPRSGLEGSTSHGSTPRRRVTGSPCMRSSPTFDPPHLLETTGDAHGVLRWELTAQARRHHAGLHQHARVGRRVPHPDVLAGWHFHLHGAAPTRCAGGQRSIWSSSPSGTPSTSATSPGTPESDVRGVEHVAVTGEVRGPLGCRGGPGDTKRSDQRAADCASMCATSTPAWMSPGGRWGRQRAAKGGVISTWNCKP